MDKYDPRYQRGKIYTITCEDGAIYVGSTIQTLKRRFNCHKFDDDCFMYKYIRDNYNGDWSKCKIKLYENYSCNNEYELNRKEGDIIRLIGTINKNIAGRTNDEYEEYRKEDKKIYQKLYRQKNKQEIAEKRNKPFECDCSIFTNKRHFARHIKTKRHQDLMDKQTSAILLFLECFKKSF